MILSKGKSLVMISGFGAKFAIRDGRTSYEYKQFFTDKEYFIKQLRKEGWR